MELPLSLSLSLFSTAGCGKSFVIEINTKMCEYLSGPVPEGVGSAVVNCAPYGSCADKLPNGATIRSRLVLKGTPKDALKSCQLQRLERTFGPASLLTHIDEKSLLGLATLGQVSRDLQRFFVHMKRKQKTDLEKKWDRSYQLDTNPNEFSFGDMPIVIILGDHRQCPPVAAREIFKIKNPKSKGIAGDWEYSGQLAFESFTSTHNLTVNERMANPLETEQQKKARLTFENFLKRCSLRLDPFEEPGMEYLNQFHRPVPDGVGNVLHAFEKKQPAMEYNLEMLKKLAGTKVLYTSNLKHERNSCRQVHHAIQNKFRVVKGALVRLTKNMSTTRTHGLYNGALGTVVACLPHTIIIQFRGYKGRPFSTAEGWEKTWVPIRPVWAHCGDKGCEYKGLEASCRRFGYPLCLAYGVNWHKIQGLSVGPGEVYEHIRLHFEGNLQKTMEKNCPGLTYAALSRAKSVDCLSLDKKVDLPRLNYGFNNESAKERQKETERVIEEARKTKERLENLWNQDQDFQ